MSIITGELPQWVEYEGQRYGVYTDFRVWIKFFDAARERDIVGMLKVYRNLPPDLETAIKLAGVFAGKGALPYGGGGDRRVLDYEYDAGLIYAAFMGEYGIDLCEVTMHWYKFCALLAGLSEERRIVKIMEIRGTNAEEFSDGEKRREWRRLQRRFAIADKRSVQERDEEMEKCFAIFY